MASWIDNSTARDMLRFAVASRMKTGRQETCMFYHRQARDMAWLNNEETTEQMKAWRRLRKTGDLVMIPENNTTRIICGKEWHILVVQSPTGISLDPIGLGFDDSQFLVRGYIYMFKNKINRDATFNYVMGVK